MRRTVARLWEAQQPVVEAARRELEVGGEGVGVCCMWGGLGASSNTAPRQLGPCAEDETPAKEQSHKDMRGSITF